MTPFLEHGETRTEFLTLSCGHFPPAQVYMGGELDERPKQGLVTQTVSKIVMGFAKQV